MVFTKSRAYDEIVAQLDKSDVIQIISCSSCARTAGTGGEMAMKELALRLQEDGFDVSGGYTINTVCTPKVLQAKAARGVNTLISMACTAGTTNVNRLFDGFKVVETTIDVGLMSADNTSKTVRIEMPYESSGDKKGNEYSMFTGTSVEEVAK